MGTAQAAADEAAITNNDFGADDAADAGGGSQQYVTFQCGERAFGIEIMSVREIRSWSPTTQLPDQPFGALGVLDIRGEVVEVFDLSAMLGGPAIEVGTGSVVLVVSLGSQDVGILVDSVSDIIDAKEQDVRKAPGGEDHGGKVSRLISNEDRLVAILNLQQLFGSHRS